MIFGVVKSEPLILCNEFKTQAKYGLEKAQSRKEMGTFCEEFGITKIKAPFSKAKQAKKAARKRFKRTNQLSNILPPTSNPKSTSFRKKKARKKQIVCYKCD